LWFVTDAAAPVLNILGFTANGLPMSGSVAAGFTLNANGQADTHYQIQFAPGSVASEALQTADVGLFLAPTAGQTAALVAYYSTKPENYKAYLNAAAAGTEPFAYIKTDGTAIRILDGAMKTLAARKLT